MAKAKVTIRKEQPESMLDQKTYEDFNKEEPSLADPNFKNNVTPSVRKLSEKKNVASKNVKADVKSYCCTKHPDMISAKPGNCPKCGMRLVAKV